MMILLRYFLIFLLPVAVLTNAKAQMNTSDISYEEKLLISTNNNFYVSGETIQLSLFCTQKSDSILSHVSKVGYLVLINESKKEMHKTKVLLQKGRGAAELFVKSSYPTGNYYLLGYTALMLNQDTSDWFIRKISIVNPFTPYENPTDSLLVEAPKVEPSQSKSVEISLEDSSFRKREMIQFSARSLSFSPLHSNLFVRRKSDLDNHQAKGRSLDSILQQGRSLKAEKKDGEPSGFSYLPDTKGELVSGYTNQADSINYPLNVYISFPGQTFHFVATTIEGVGDTFNVSIPRKIQSDQILVTSPECVACEFSLIEKSLTNYDFVSTEKLVLNENQLEEIRSRSIKAQIQNAYTPSFEDKPTKEDHQPFYGSPDKVYHLSDYTAFSNIEDVFREITTNISLRNTEEGYRIRLIGKKREVIEDPLILINGVVIHDHSDLLKLQVSKIEKIETVSERYHMGHVFINGIISITMTPGAETSLIHASVFDYLKVTEFEGIADKHQAGPKVPEYSQVIYWDPMLHLKPGQTKTIVFQAGDDPGRYEIILETLAEEGNLITTASEFEIK